MMMNKTWYFWHWNACALCQSAIKTLKHLQNPVSGHIEKMTADFVLIAVSVGVLAPFTAKGSTDITVTSTHWGWVTYICVSNLTIIGSDNGLSPGRR